jgi:signal transduction histidine kinase
MRTIDQDMRRWLASMIVAILAIDLLLILSVYWVLWQTVLRPLTDIERYALDVNRGGSDAAPPATSGPTTELESLRIAVETMVRLQESLRRSEIMSAMGALVGGVAHEVRNPLFGMTAMLDAYRDEMKDPNLEPLVTGLRAQVSRLTSLTRELLQFGRPVRIEPVPGSIASVIVNAVAGRGDAARRAQVTLRTDLAEGLPPVAMDRERLCQVFENLIDNAILHSPGGGSVSVSARAVPLRGRTWIECRVADEGAGFAPDDLAHAFEPFFTRRPAGTGLGLSIVQRIVQEHSGSVFADNATTGAVLTVLLPASESPHMA